MDVSAYVTIATALLGVLSSIITQVSKRYVPKQWRPLFALGVSILIAVIAIIVGNAFTSGIDITTVVFGVIAVAQAVYATVDKLVNTADSDVQ